MIACVSDLFSCNRLNPLEDRHYVFFGIDSGLSLAQYLCLYLLNKQKHPYNLLRCFIVQETGSSGVLGRSHAAAQLESESVYVQSLGFFSVLLHMAALSLLIFMYMLSVEAGCEEKSPSIAF